MSGPCPQVLDGKFLSPGLALVQQALGLILTAFIGLQVSSWQLRQYGFKMEKYVYIQSQRSLNIQKSFTQIKKTPNGKAKGQVVNWEVSGEGETLVLQSKGKQRNVSSDWEPGVRTNSANRYF